MGKLFSKNKKILFLLGFVLFLSLTLIPRFALAVDCSQYNENNCPSPDCEVVWVYDALGQPIPGTGNCLAAAGEATKQATKWCDAAPWNLVGWVKCILEFLFSLPIKIPFFFIAAVGVLLAIIGGVFLLIAQPLASVMIQLSLSSNIPDEINNITGTVRGIFISILFLFLAIIGLATILRIAEYQAKKALVPLIIVALLINFSTPIATTVVNIGNGFTNYFINQVGQGGEITIIDGNDLLNAFTTGITGLWDIFWADGQFFENLVKPGADSILVRLGIFTSFGFVAALFFILTALAILIFGLVFFIRIIYIWILIIIAPIAFVSAVFKTKEIKAILPGPLNWDGWWTSLLEWSFMGVGLAFWLFLAKNLNIPFTITSTSATGISATILNDTNFTTMLGKFFGYLAPLVALWIGVTTAPGMMGQMASQVYGKAKGFVTAVAVGGAIAGIAGGIAGFKRGFGNQWAEKREAGAGAIKAGVSGIGAGVKSGLTTMGRRGFGKGLEEIGKPIPAEIKEEAVPLWAKRKFITTKEEAKKNIDETFEEEGPKGVERIVTSKLDTDVTRKAALDKLMEENKVSKELVGNSEGQRIILSDYEEAARLGNTKKTAKIERTALSLGEDFGEIARKTGIYTTNDKNKDNTKGITTYTQHIVASTKTADDVKQLQKGWWENHSVMETAQKFWTGNQWGAAGREFGKELIDSLEPITTQLKSFQATNNTKGYLHSVWDRPGLARFSETTTAQELGFSSFYELAPKSLDQKKYPNIRAILAEKPPTPTPTPPPRTTPPGKLPYSPE